MGANKAGEIEYSGKEIGTFVLELAKGNPRNIELSEYRIKRERTVYRYETTLLFLFQPCPLEKFSAAPTVHRQARV